MKTSLLFFSVSNQKFSQKYLTKSIEMVDQ